MNASTVYCKEVKDYQGLCIDSSYRALAALLRGDSAAAIAAAQEALRLAEEDARATYPMARDYGQAYWLLGWAALSVGDLAHAQRHLDEALRRCRAIAGDWNPPFCWRRHGWRVPIRLRRSRRSPPPPADNPNVPAVTAGGFMALGRREARLIAACRVRLVTADIHNHLALLALDAGDKSLARQHAQQAYEYAFCDGPPCVYQPALDERRGCSGAAA
ncbi:MAG: hypothetical protein R3E31_16220 [Chloroflexota bacterium]